MAPWKTKPVLLLALMIIVNFSEWLNDIKNYYIFIKLKITFSGASLGWGLHRLDKALRSHSSRGWGGVRWSTVFSDFSELLSCFPPFSFSASWVIYHELNWGSSTDQLKNRAVGVNFLCLGMTLCLYQGAHILLRGSWPFTPVSRWWQWSVNLEFHFRGGCSS